MKKTKLATLALSAVLAVGTLGVITGCGESGPQDGQTSIRFWYTTSISQSNVLKAAVDVYNKGQGVEDGVFVEADNRQNVQKNALYVDAPNVLMLDDANFKAWALEGLFTDLDEYYEQQPENYTEESIPQTMTERWRINKEKGADGIRIAGEGADRQGIPCGAAPMAYYYSIPNFEDQNINIISCEEEALAEEYPGVQPHGYAEYKEQPFEGAVSSTNLAGDTVYKVFNNRIPMNWEEFRYISKMFTKTYNPDSPTTIGGGSHWWFAYGWSVGGDCIGWNGEHYEFTAADKEANWLVLTDELELNGTTYSAGEIVEYADRDAVADAPAGSVHELPSQYDALKEFVCLTTSPDGNGGKGERGYGVGLYTGDQAVSSLTTNGFVLYAGDATTITALDTSYAGKYDIAPAQQWREYEGGSVYYEGAESFANEYLKVIGETYDGEVYTGELAVDEATGTPFVGRATTHSAVNGLVIPERSDASKKDAAWKFIRWLASAEGQAEIFDTGWVPNQTELAYSDEFISVGNGKNYYALSFNVQGSNIGDWAYFENGEWVEEWSPLFNNNLRAGLITIDEFIAEKGAVANEDCAAVDIYINGRW